MSNLIELTYRNVLDSRDIADRINELEDELKALDALKESAIHYNCEWNDGAILISDSYFEDYAKELAEDIGAIDPYADLPLSHIDWGSAAEELRKDYTSIDFCGQTFWIANTG